MHYILICARCQWEYSTNSSSKQGGTVGSTFHLPCGCAEQIAPQIKQLSWLHFLLAVLLLTEGGQRHPYLKAIGRSWNEKQKYRLSFKPGDSFVDTHFIYQFFLILGFSGRAIEHFLISLHIPSLNKWKKGHMLWRYVNCGAF